ncbi:MAG TPA: hypothetical protein VKO18_00595 [Terriglobia bacterium]|nr:hypothetical protein [Terriglobia bacterium]
MGIRLARIVDAKTLLFILAALIFLYAVVFVPPFLPIQLNSPDSIFYLAQGQRVYEGETIYRDFFEFVTPGTALVYALLFNLFGHRLWIPNLASVVLGLGFVGLGVLIAKKLMRPSLALLPSAIFLVGLREWLCDPTHHWYSLLGAMAGMAVLMERRTPARIAAAGSLCGLSACFTQTRGLAAAVGLGVFLWWESGRSREGGRELLKKEGQMAGGFLATIIPVNAYFIWKAGPARFLWCTVVFVLKYLPKFGSWNTFQAYRQSFNASVLLYRSLQSSTQWTFLYVLLPLIYVLFFVRYRRQCSQKPNEFWERPMLVAMVGSFLLLSILPAPSPIRVASSALPGIILLVWFLDSPQKLARAIAAALAVGVLVIAPHAVARVQSRQKWILTTPQGSMALTDPELGEKLAWIQDHTRPGEYFYAAGPDAYFYLDLRNPTPLPRLKNNGYTTVEQVVEVVRGLEQHQPRYALWPLELGMAPDREVLPDDHLDPVRDYIQSHYQKVKAFTDSAIIWERKD